MARHIRIVNYYGSTNLGDEMMFRGLLGTLDDLNPGSRFSVTTEDPERERTLFPGIEFYRRLVPMAPMNVPRLIRGMTRLAQLKTGVAGTVRRDQSLQDLKASDLVVTHGGPRFRDWPYKRLGAVTVPGLGFLTPLAELMAADWYGKEFKVVGQTIGPIEHPYSKYLIGRTLSKATTLAVREPISGEILAEMSPALKDRVQVVPDLALAPRLYGMEAVEAKRREDLIGGDKKLRVLVAMGELALSSRQFISKEGDIPLAEVQERYYQFFMQNLRAIAKMGPHQITFLCHAPHDDEKMWARLTQDLKGVAEMAMIPYGTSSAERLAEYKKADLALTVRYHSAVFSIRMGCPVLAFAQMPKLPGLFTLAGLEDSLVPAEALRVEPDTDRVRDIVAHLDDWRERFQQASARLQQEFAAWGRANLVLN